MRKIFFAIVIIFMVISSPKFFKYCIGCLSCVITMQGKQIK